MSWASDDELALLSAIVDGDEEAADRFDSRFRPYLLRFVRNRVPPPHESDVVQEALLSAFQQISKGNFSGTSSVGTWLIGILRHKVADFWQSQSTNPSARPLGAEFGEGRLSLAGVPMPGPTQVEVAIETEQLLARLSRVQRVALLLKYREGWTTDQIGKALHLPAGTVSRTLWEAKRRLNEIREGTKEIPRAGDK